MSKTLKQFLEVYKPKSPDEQKFVDKHVTIKHKDRNGNGDDVFTASNIKTAKRKEERHGYDAGEDEKVYEETELDESAKIAAHLVKRYGDNVRKSHVRSAANDFGVDASKLAKAVRKKLGVDTLKEAEQLDELSPKTLGSYIKKAAKSASNTSHDELLYTKTHDDELAADQARKNKNRLAGINKAANKLMKKAATNEEAEQIDELSTSTLKKYRAAAKADAIDADAVDDNRRYNQRAAGYKKAGKVITKRGENMLAKEEAESVEEMAPPGAKYERMVKHVKKGYAKGGLSDRERAIAYATAWKAKKANEGVEYVVPTPEEQLIEKINSLSESNQETMISVFEQLSEDNKAKFVEYCNTPEGVNAMLDFAIDNRGE